LSKIVYNFAGQAVKRFRCPQTLFVEMIFLLYQTASVSSESESRERVLVQEGAASKKILKKFEKYGEICLTFTANSI
jgi:hypothetical protein